MTTDNLSAQKPFTIPVGTDFNGLVQPGTYQQLWYDATAQNTPTGGNACQLAVSRIADNVILQTCTVWRGGLVYETYQRIREAGTWTAWDKLLSANDVQRAAVTAQLISAMPSTAGNTDIPLSVTAQVGATWEVQDGALVCPMDGYAIASGGLMIGGGAAGHYCGVEVRKNNARVVDLYFGYSINYGAIATRPVLVRVQAGDLLRLSYRGDSTADISASSRTGLTAQYV